MSQVTQIRTFAGAIAVLLLLGFASIYGYGIVACWLATDCALVTFQPQVVYVATSLAGLISAVVAMIFNEKESFQATVTADSTNVLQIISVAYVVAYFITGFAAIVTWLVMGTTPDLIQNLAFVTMGLMLAIGRIFFNLPQPETTKE